MNAIRNRKIINKCFWIQNVLQWVPPSSIEIDGLTSTDDCQNEIAGVIWKEHCDFSHACTQKVHILISGINITCLLRNKYHHKCPEECTVFSRHMHDRTVLDDLQSLIQIFLLYFSSTCYKPYFWYSRFDVPIIMKYYTSTQDAWIHCLSPKKL